MPLVLLTIVHLCKNECDVTFERCRTCIQYVIIFQLISFTILLLTVCITCLCMNLITILCSWKIHVKKRKLYVYCNERYHLSQKSVSIAVLYCMFTVEPLSLPELIRKTSSKKFGPRVKWPCQTYFLHLKDDRKPWCITASQKMAKNSGMAVIERLHYLV